MLTKKKLCSNCNTEQFIWKNDKGNKYCKYCWYKSKSIDAKPLKRTPIKQKSKKMQVIDSAYSKLRIKFLEQNPMCQAALHCCTGSSTDVHHKKGRGEYHLVVSTWLSSCRSCHMYIEEHPKEAIELGLSTLRI
jgi:hypothetical protein